MEEWSDFRYFAQAEHFNTKNFFLRVLNTKNFTHYHDMFPSTAGKKSMLQIYFATLLHIALSFI